MLHPYFVLALSDLTNNVHVTVDWITNIAMKHCRHCQNINCSISSNNVSTMMIMFIIVILFSFESMVTARRIFGETELNPGVLKKFQKEGLKSIYLDIFLFIENSNECIDFHGIPHPLDQDFQFRNNCGKGRCFKKGQKVFIELNGCVKNVCVDIMLTYLRFYYDDSGAEWHLTRPVE